MQVAFDEAKETIGFALLPILEKVINFINKNALPVINAFAGAFSGNNTGLSQVISVVGDIIVNRFTPIINGLVKAFGYVKNAIAENLDEFIEFGGYIATYLAPVIGTVLGGALQVAGKIASGVITVIAGVVGVLNNLISGAVAGINALIRAYNSIPFLPNVSTIATPTVPNIPTPTLPTTPTVPKVPTIPSPTSSGGSSGSSGGGGGGVARAASVAAATAVASSGLGASGGSGVNTNTLAGIMAASGTTINVNVSGAMDKEGTARTIVETLNNSYYRGTGGAGNLQFT
jgi:hypothetical protein